MSTLGVSQRRDSGESLQAPMASWARSQRAMSPATTLTLSDLLRTVRRCSLASAGVCGGLILRSLFKRQFKEVQADGGPEGREVGSQRSPVVSVENAPGFDVGDRSLDWGAQAAYVRVVKFSSPIQAGPCIAVS